MRHLLAYLNEEATIGRAEQWQWQRWRLRRMGGANNVVIRATDDSQDVAIKFTIRDERRRAWREYQALHALRQAGLAIAPRPILLDEDGYRQPVVVQAWVTGRITADPPQSAAAWGQLITHFAAVHSVTPARVEVPLAVAVLNFDSVRAGKLAIQQELARIPQQARPAALDEIRHQLAARQDLPDYFSEKPPVALCRVDPNTLNFVRRPGAWYSVDWENSGWGDPAFDIADLITHPQYTAVPLAAWTEWVAHYGQLSGDATAIDRIWAYYPLLLVWWVARFARMLYEVPRGLDRRLVSRAPDWQAHLQTNMDRYVMLAATALDKKKPGTRPGEHFNY